MKIRLRDVCESVDGGHGPLQSSHEKDWASTWRKQKKKKNDITCGEHASFSYRALKLHFFICHCVPSLLAEVLTCVKQKTLFTFGDQQTTQGYVSYIGFSAYFGFVQTFICKIVTNNVHVFPTTLYRCKSISPFCWRSVSSLIVTNFLYNLFNCNVSARNFYTEGRSFFSPYYSPPALVELINIEYSTKWWHLRLRIFCMICR